MYVTIANQERPSTEPIVVSRDTLSLRKTLRAGSYLFFEGDDVSSLYMIERGVVRLTRVFEDGRRQVIAFGYPGDIVGFPARRLHHTDCDALTETQVRPISRNLLEDSRIDPKLHATLMNAALNEISAMQDHFMMLGRKTAAEKVASFLQVLFNRLVDNEAGTVIDLPMNRSDIADFLGLTTETVSRCFTALRKAGIIRLKGVNKVEVVEANFLARRAEGRLN